ncbi:MAG: TadE/TadG family type IV pilus assembly protein [Acidimicrobiales bacterium]
MENSAKRTANRHDSERGAAALELALALPVLLLLIYGIIQFGTVFLVRQDLTEATSDAARSSVAVSQSSAVSTALAQVVGDISNDSAGLVSVPSGGNCPTSGAILTCSVTAASCPIGMPATDNCLTVTVTYQYQQDPIIPDFFGIPLPTITASSTVLLAGSGTLSS